MRVGVIRADIAKPLFIADVEPTSQYNPMTDAKGQTRYVSRPDATRIQAYLDAQGLVAVAATLITATVPVGGPVDVSSATITGVAGLGAATPTQVLALQDFLAPRFVDTRQVRESYLAGNLFGFRSASFNPDPTRVPAFTPGAAIACVEDDGVTATSYALPSLMVADLDTPAPGMVTLSGGGLFNVDAEFVVTFTGSLNKRVERRAIELAGGSLSAATVVIPASLIPGAVLTTTFARVRNGSFMTSAVALT